MGFDALHVQNKTSRKGNMYNESRSNKGCLNSDVMGLYVVDISLSSCLYKGKFLPGNQGCHRPLLLRQVLPQTSLGILNGAGCFPSELYDGHASEKIPWISTMLEPPWARTWAMVHTIYKVPFAKDPTLRKLILFNRSIAISAKEKMYAQMVYIYIHVYTHIYIFIHIYIHIYILIYDMDYKYIYIYISQSYHQRSTRAPKSTFQDHSTTQLIQSATKGAL